MEREIAISSEVCSKLKYKFFRNSIVIDSTDCVGNLLRMESSFFFNILSINLLKI